jgi:predicted cupin superfamily sugar epimerase
VDAESLVAALGLAPQPEGGWFRETFRTDASTAIYFLVTEASPSHLHRVIDADEVFHHYTGAAVEQLVDTEARWIGTDLAAGQRPQSVVPAGAWQGCRVEAGGGWALLGCTVAPAFRFEGFELAPEGWHPGR